MILQGLKWFTKKYKLTNFEISEMMIKICLTIFTCLIFTSVEAAEMGQRCRSNADCQIRGSECGSKAPFCPGTCNCRPGYRQVGDECLRLIPFGKYCLDGGVCNGKNNECSDGICQCKLGFKRYRSTDDCIDKLGGGFVNDHCLDPVMCVGWRDKSMVCSKNTCQCTKGYKSENGICKKRMLLKVAH